MKGFDDHLDNYGIPDEEPEPLDELDSSGVTEQYQNVCDHQVDPDYVCPWCEADPPDEL